MSDAPYIEPPAGNVLPPPQPPAADAMGLAPGFSRDPRGGLTRDGKPPDTMFPGGMPGWQEGPPKPFAPPQFGNPPDTIEPPAGGGKPRGAAADYVQRTMALEGSGKDPNSTAIGGFLNGTWLNLVKKNIPQAAGLPDEQILAARADPVLRAKMVEAYAKENAGALVQAGYQPNASNLRLAHWFGAAGALRILNSPPEKPLAQIFPSDVIQANSLEGKTAGDVLKQVSTQMNGPATHLREQWNGALSPESRQLMDEMKERGERDHTENMELMKRYEKAAAEAPAGSKERADAIADMRKTSHRLMEQWEDLTKHPPVKKPIDMWQNFGSAATIVALLGGLLSRRHLTAGLAAAGQAMMAINTNNAEEFAQHYKTWEQQTSLGLKMVDLQNQEIRSLLDDEKLARDEKQARLQTLFQEYGMQHQDQTLRAGNDLRLVEMVNANERAASAAKNQASLIQQQVFANLKAKYLGENMSEADATARAAQEAGITHPTLADPKKMAAQAMIDEVRAKTGHDPTSADWTKYFQDTGRAQTGQLSPEAVKLLAHQYEMGDPGVITALPRSGPARIQLENQVAEDLKGMDDGAAQIVMNRLRMAEARSAATTAGRVTMNTEVYSQEAKDAGKEVIRTSNLFPRTEIPKVNQAIAAYERNTGDPKIIQFGVAINALRNAYGKLSNPTGIGVHDADKEKFAQILDTSLSKGQIDAGVEQIIREGVIVSNAARKAQEEVLSHIMPRQPGAEASPPSSAASPVGLQHEKEAIAAGAPRDAVRKRYIQNGGDAATFDREVPR